MTDICQDLSVSHRNQNACYLQGLQFPIEITISSATYLIRFPYGFPGVRAQFQLAMIVEVRKNMGN